MSVHPIEVLDKIQEQILLGVGVQKIHFWSINAASLVYTNCLRERFAI